MGLNILTLGSSKTYTDESLLGLGSLKGAPCTIKSITEVDGGQKVTFEWIGTSGTKQTSEMTVKNGVSVTGISDKGNGVFTLLFSDGSESDPIQTIKGEKGDKGDKLTFNDLSDEEKASLKGDVGFSPTITENADNTDKIYKLDIETVDGKFTTPNLKGADGQGGSGGIIDAPINSISVNGVNVLPDENKNVDITVPEAYDDAELLDIRVKVDGTTATSAGNAVREQFNELKGDIENLKQSGTVTGGLTAKQNNTLIDIVNAIAYFDVENGADAVNLINSFNAVWKKIEDSGETGPEPTVTLTSISATYSGGDVVEGTNLSDLTGITVTAHYSDDSTADVTDYSLSGTISVGSNTITVYYQGLTTTFEVVGIENTSSGVYGASLAWQAPADYNKWSENGNWFWVSYSSNTAAIQVENGFSLEKVYSKPIDGLKYKYFRVPTANGKQYSVANNIAFYGSDSPNALTESGHPITKCTRNMQFLQADIDSSLDSEGFTIVYPSEEYEYYYIQFATNNSLTSSYPDLVGVFDAGILDNPLAEATE